ncbi:hypothetical protein BCR32DRAFT_273007 [Anaeromyces robustus]|uniref:FHF complex subunit HOOK-interacting protein C-terminal domain-containing protein n=1 Tax=Anaeromyces robustus TaxID=1754192 RepID=A0A1Y1VTS2_9FUNG|nr:hypothetical protein BCR32DRAFT_273007 [Anaeromyces robustus]|eukprot:ORX64687.1 hypothetical protein BCR32DRAFT_273007 [Anaeromyces robustus]
MSMINDIEEKLKEISNRFKKKSQVVLTPQQKNLIKLKKIWSYIDTHHGPQYKDVYITNTPLPNYVQTMLSLLEMEERQIMSNPNSPMNSPNMNFQGITNSNQAGICMEFMLGNNIFVLFADAALEDQPFGLLQVVIESFSHLCGELNAAFLTRHSVQRALNKLIYVTATTPKLNELYEDYLIELIFILCQKMREIPTLLNFFMYPKKNKDLKNAVNFIPKKEMPSYYFSSIAPESSLSPLSNNSPYYIANTDQDDDPTNGADYEFFIFNYLMNYYFKAGNQGDYALTAISILLELDDDYLYKYLLDNDFPLVITASLCGSFAALPKNKDSGYLEVNVDDYPQQNNDIKFNNVKEFVEMLKIKVDKEKERFYLKNKTFKGHIINDELNIFLRIFQFIQKITTDCKNEKMVNLFLHYIHIMFIKNILNNHLFSSNEIEDEDYNCVSYLKLIFNNLQSPILSQLFIENLFPESIGENDNGNGNNDDKNDETFLKSINTIYQKYIKIMMDKDYKKLKELQQLSDDHENDENQNTNDNDISNKKSYYLSSISLYRIFEDPEALAKEIEEKINDPNYNIEKFKDIFEIDEKIHLHYAKESSISKFSTSSMKIAAICQNTTSPSLEENKNLYQYILTRLKGGSQGLKYITLQLLSTLLTNQNSINTHKLFPCHYYSQEKLNQCQKNNHHHNIVNITSPDGSDMNVEKLKKENDTINKRKKLEMEYIKLFYCIHPFQKLFQMNMNYFSNYIIQHDEKIENKNLLQLNRYYKLFSSLELPNINSRLFIYPYILDASSSIQYNKSIDKIFSSILCNPLFNKLTINQEKINDILSIMKGYQSNQLLQCLFDIMENWLDNPYEINIILTDVFHQLLTTVDHLFLEQYLIMNDQLFNVNEEENGKDEEKEKEKRISLYTILQDLIEKINKNYKIIKSSSKIHQFYLSMYDKLKEVQESIKYRNKSSYITLESAVDVSNICNYGNIFDDLSEEDSKEFNNLLQDLDEQSRQDLLNMFKLSTIKNIMVLMEFLKDIIASIHIQLEQISFS